MGNRSYGRVLVTSGPTRCYVDRIRYFTNTSSGALGSRIVEALVKRSIPVVHIYGLGSETPKVIDSRLLESIMITTVEDLIDTVKKIAINQDITAVVHAMAVLDYVSESLLETKRESGEKFWNIKLVRTPKVIGLMRNIMPNAFFTGFKLETGVLEKQLIEKSGVLLDTYNLDLVIANDIDRVNEEKHEAFFLGIGNKVFKRLHTKTEIAENIAGLIAERFK